MTRSTHSPKKSKGRDNLPPSLIDPLFAPRCLCLFAFFFFEQTTGELFFSHRSPRVASHNHSRSPYVYVLTDRFFFFFQGHISSAARTRTSVGATAFPSPRKTNSLGSPREAPTPDALPLALAVDSSSSSFGKGGGMAPRSDRLVSDGMGWLRPMMARLLVVGGGSVWGWVHLCLSLLFPFACLSRAQDFVRPAGGPRSYAPVVCGMKYGDDSPLREIILLLLATISIHLLCARSPCASLAWSSV